MNEVSTEKTMTVKEVAEVLGYQPDTIQKTAKRLESENIIGRIEIRSDSTHAMLLSKEQVQTIKTYLVPRDLTLKNKVESAITEIDRQKTIMLAMQYLKEDYDKMKQRAEIAEQKCIEQRPKVEFAETITADQHSTFDMAHVAQELKLPYGKNTLFAILRDLGTLKSDNTPYQRYVDTGYFKVYPVPTPVGTKLTTKVTQRGIDYIRKVVQMYQKEGK